MHVLQPLQALVLDHLLAAIISLDGSPNKSAINFSHEASRVGICQRSDHRGLPRSPQRERSCIPRRRRKLDRVPQENGSISIILAAGCPM